MRQCAARRCNLRSAMVCTTMVCLHFIWSQAADEYCWPFSVGSEHTDGLKDKHGVQVVTAKTQPRQL